MGIPGKVTDKTWQAELETFLLTQSAPQKSNRQDANDAGSDSELEGQQPAGKFTCQLHVSGGSTCLLLNWERSGDQLQQELTTQLCRSFLECVTASSDVQRRSHCLPQGCSTCQHLSLSAPLSCLLLQPCMAAAQLSVVHLRHPQSRPV